MNRLQELRKEKGMTQDDIAKIVNVNRSVISKYESGTVPLTDDTILILANYLGVSSDYLLGRTGISKTPTKKSPIYDDEALKLMEDINNRSELRKLLSISQTAKKEDIELVVLILEKLAESSHVNHPTSDTIKTPRYKPSRGEILHTDFNHGGLMVAEEDEKYSY